MISPGEFLLLNYISPSGGSITSFAKHVGVDRFTTERFIKGKEVSYSFLFRLAKGTNTCARMWIHFQTNWLFLRYVDTRKIKAINPYVRASAKKNKENSIGKILDDNFLTPMAISLSHLAVITKIDSKTLFAISQGTRRITPNVAAKLGMQLGTGAKHWLDIQLYFELEKALKQYNSVEIKRNKLFAEYHKSLLDSSLDKKRYCAIKQIEHPGRVLFRDHLKRSKIRISDWPRLFCISSKVFDSIINGRCEIPALLILKLSRLIDTNPEYWFEMQNRYYATKSESEEMQRNVDSAITKERSGQDRYTIPVSSLVNDFLRPMKISVADLADHIGVKINRLYSLTTGNVKFGFELAIRISQAFGMNPEYWILLQLEQDINNYRAKIGLIEKN